MQETPSGMWSGTANELLAKLVFHASEDIRRMSIWPRTAASMSNNMDRVAPLIRSKGIECAKKRTGKARLITLARINDYAEAKAKNAPPSYP